MKIPVYFLILILEFIANISVAGQNNTLKVYTAYSIGKVDKRIDFLRENYTSTVVQTAINNLKNNTPDDEHAIGVSYVRKLNKRLGLGIDIGYAQLVQDFLLPANGQSYFDAHGEIFFWRDKSWYHFIQIGPQVQYLFTTGKFNFGVNLQAIGNVSFRKHIKAFNLTRNKTEYFSTEVYPGLTFGYWRLHANIGYRALHWKYRDDAIANNGLNPDKYNPFKMKFTLSYDIYRW